MVLLIGFIDLAEAKSAKDYEKIKEKSSKDRVEVNRIKKKLKEINEDNDAKHKGFLEWRRLELLKTPAHKKCIVTRDLDKEEDKEEAKVYLREKKRIHDEKLEQGKKRQKAWDSKKRKRRSSRSRRSRRNCR